MSSAAAHEERFDSSVWFDSFDDLLATVSAVAWEIDNVAGTVGGLIGELELVEQGVAAWSSRPGADEWGQPVDLRADLARADELLAAASEVRSKVGELRRTLNDVLKALKPVEKAIRAWPPANDDDDDEEQT